MKFLQDQKLTLKVAEKIVKLKRLVSITLDLSTGYILTILRSMMKNNQSYNIVNCNALLIAEIELNILCNVKFKIKGIKFMAEKN